MSKSNTIFLTLCFLLVSIAPVHAQTSASVTVADLIPHTVGCYVDYNEYDTTTTGSAAAKSHASYTITAVDDTNGDITVLDSIGGGNPSGIHQLFYSLNNPNDLQAYADTALINFMIPSEIAAGVTNIPNRWVDYFNLSAGPNNPYPIDTLNSKVTYSGQTVTVTIFISGEYKGIEKVTVPYSATPYDSAYRFDISALIKLSALGGIVTGSFTSTQSNWLVRGVGVVKTNAPIDSTSLAGSPVTTDGRETEMTNYGIAGSAGVARNSMSAPGISIYPDPASDAVTISLPKPSKQILLYASDGLMARSFDISGNGSAALLWINDLPNGYYIARVKYADGSTGSASMVVRH
jgi:hypothetical protein